MRLISEAELNVYKDIEGSLIDIVPYHDDSVIYNDNRNTSTLSNRSKSQHINSRVKSLKQMAEEQRLRANNDQDVSTRQMESIDYILDLYDRNYLENNNSTPKMGCTNVNYSNVDFTKLSEIDFDTNRKAIQNFLEDITEEEESSFLYEKPKVPLKSILHKDIQLI